jgi:hypothetical protein
METPQSQISSSQNGTYNGFYLNLNDGTVNRFSIQLTVNDSDLSHPTVIITTYYSDSESLAPITESTEISSEILTNTGPGMYYVSFVHQIYIINIFQNQIIFNFSIRNPGNLFGVALKI